MDHNIPLENLWFAKEYGYVHNTSGLKYPQSNGEAKRGVRTVKALLKKTEYPYLSLLAYTEKTTLLI